MLEAVSTEGHEAQKQNSKQVVLQFEDFQRAGAESSSSSKGSSSGGTKASV